MLKEEKDPFFYPVIYGADRDDDWTDPKYGKKQILLSLGVTVPLEKSSKAFQSAKQNPAEENAFRQLRLTINGLSKLYKMDTYG